MNKQEFKIGDAVIFKSDRYTTELGVIEEILSSGSLYVRIIGGGGIGNKMVNPEKCQLANDEAVTKG